MTRPPEDVAREIVETMTGRSSLDIREEAAVREITAALTARPSAEEVARLRRIDAAAREYRDSVCPCQNHLPPFVCEADCERRSTGLALDAALAEKDGGRT